MKTFIASLIVLLLLLIGINVYTRYLETTINDITEQVKSVSEAAYKKDWEDCKGKVKKLVNIWSKKEPVLAMFNDHEDVDNIKLSISKLKESILHENYEETFKCLGETVILLDRIKKNSTLTLENILSLAQFGTLCHIML